MSRGLGFVDPFARAQGGASEPSPCAGYAVMSQWRQKANSGLLEIRVLDPSTCRAIWVDAIYDAANDEVIPLDNKYRDTSKRYSIANMFGQRFADSTDTSGIVPGSEPPPLHNSNSSMIVVGIAALLVLWWATD